MKEHPKFTCRREGHVPQVKVKNTAQVSTSYFTVCIRCGEWLEITLEPDQAEKGVDSRP